MAYFEQFKILEQLSKDVNNSEEVLKLIKSDPDLFRDFFQKLDISIDWFWILQEFYNPKQISFDENGRTRFWIVLQYLEKVSILNKDDNVFEELLKIIKSIIDYSKNEKEINDYFNWWHVAKILVNVPINIIIKHYQDSKVFCEAIFEITDHEDTVSLSIEEFGEKLLPKLLEAKESDFALKIIDLITTIEKPDISDTIGSCKAKFETYNIDKIFKNNYQKIIESQDSKIIELLINKFNDSLMLNRFESKEYFEYNDNYYEIKISRIQETDSSIKDNQYLFSISEYDKTEYEQAKKDVKENMFDIHYQMYLNKFKPQREIIKVEFSGGLENLKNTVYEDLENTVLRDAELSEELARVYHNLFADFFNIKISDFDSDDDIAGSRDDASIMLLGIIKEIFLQYINQGNEIVEKYIKEFLSDKHIFPIFKKLAFYFIYKSGDKYLEIFKDQVEINSDIFTDWYFELEIYNILKDLNHKFSQSLIEKIGSCIEAKSKEFDQEKQDKFLFRWYSALKDNDQFKAKYEKLKKDEPYTSFIDSVTVREYSSDNLVSPITGEHISKMVQTDINEFVNYLKDYKSEYSQFDQEFYGKPGTEGLASKLSFVVKKQPDIFIDNLEKFQGVDLLYYLKNILNGIQLAQYENDEKKTINYEKLMDFAVSYFESIKWEETVRNEYNHNDNTQRNIVSSIIGILRKGIELKNIEICEENKLRIETLIDKLLVFPLKDAEFEIKDYITYTLNTILGKLIMLYVDFSLKYASTQGKEVNWGTNKFEKLYSKGIEGKILFGYYLPQMNYLDKEYVSEKIKNFKEIKEDWVYFISGYISSSKLYLDIVNLMRDNYIQAIEYEKLNKLVERKLIEHIALTYLYYNDSLDKESNDDGNLSLIFKLFNTLNDKFTERMMSLSEYIGMRHNEGKKNELIELWKYIYRNRDKIKEKMGKKYKEFPGRLIEISKLIDKIDEEFAEIMKWNIKFVKSYHIQHFFKTLTKFESADQIHFISDILTDMLGMPVPTYDKGYIKILVERMYKIPELKPKADEICNAYGRQGVHFLRKLYDEKNKG